MDQKPYFVITFYFCPKTSKIQNCGQVAAVAYVTVVYNEQVTVGVVLIKYKFSYCHVQLHSVQRHKASIFIPTQAVLAIKLRWH